MYSNNTWLMVRTGETVSSTHLASDIHCMQHIPLNGMHSSLHQFMRIRKISLRCFSLSLAADAWRKKRKPHAYPRQSTNTHAVNTHQNNDITYFGGPRLQAVGIATDEESHFPNKRGKLSSEREKQKRVPLRIQMKKHSTWPWCQRTRESRSIRVIRDHQKRALQEQFCALLQNPIQTHQHSTNFLFIRAQLQESRKLYASAPFWSRAALDTEPNADAIWGERQNPALGLVPLLHPASERASLAGDSPSRHVHRLDALPLKTERLGVRGTERSPAEKHDITCAGRGGVGRGDCIRAIGCAEEKRGEETRASLLIRQQPASSANSTVHKQFINDNDGEHKSLLEKTDGEIRSLCKCIPSARAPWSVALFFVNVTKAHFCSGMRKREPIIRSGSEHNAKHCIKKRCMSFLLQLREHTEALASSLKMQWEVRLNPMPARLRSSSMTSSLSEAANGSAAHGASRGLSEALPLSGFSSSVWFVSGTDQNQRRSTHGKDLRAES